jgi:hypothetical protein
VNIFTGAAEREVLKRDTTAHNFANQLLNLYLESRATPGISASNEIKKKLFFARDMKRNKQDNYNNDFRLEVY